VKVRHHVEPEDPQLARPASPDEPVELLCANDGGRLASGREREEDGLSESFQRARLRFVPSTVAPQTNRSLSVPGAALTEFEPQGLGPFHPRFRRLLSAIGGQRQSEIRSLLRRECNAVSNGPESQHSEAYLVSLLVLRDYLSSGYYPVITGNHCLLAPIFESSALSPARRKMALQKMYEIARTRSLLERKQFGWIAQTAAIMRRAGYDPAPLIAGLCDGPPRLRIIQVTKNDRVGDDRGVWRAVRATWSMGPELSAPGREVAVLIEDERHPGVPLGIAQFRNVVPEIQARDQWLGLVAGVESNRGFLALLGRDPSQRNERIQRTRKQLELLLEHVNPQGLEGVDFADADLAKVAAILRGAQQRYSQERKDGLSDGHRHLAVVKRAETVTDLTRGIRALTSLLSMEDLRASLQQQPQVRRDLDAGLKKLWHYHMGFVAIEMSICGAAPPFGPLRVGKLIAALAGSREVIDAWGSDRPLGSIASTVFRPEVRDAMPNPGPLVIFTSGLYPGHSAQYNRAVSGPTRWVKLGNTTGFGSFHISVDTARAIEKFNETVDGYARITKAFGEGSGARFRSVGRALGRLGLPDLRNHETQRPVYALPLVESPQEVLLGWSDVRPSSRPAGDDLAAGWWHRWVEPRETELALRAEAAPHLLSLLDQIARDLDGRPTL
jgi:hypothetical protein